MRVLLVVAILAAAPAARGDDSLPGPEQHKGQLGVSLRLGTGIRGIAPFDSKEYCGKSDSTAAYGNAPVCTARSPLALDLELGYGVTSAIDLLVELKLGLERDFGPTPNADGPRVVQLAPGARFFFSEAKRTKLFIQPELVLDFTGYKNDTGGDLGTNIGARSLEGFWIDLHRAYGLYFWAGQTIEVTKWFSFELDAGIGFQGRYP